MNIRKQNLTFTELNEHIFRVQSGELKWLHFDENIYNAVVEKFCRQTKNYTVSGVDLALGSQVIYILKKRFSYRITMYGRYLKVEKTQIVINREPVETVEYYSL